VLVQAVRPVLVQELRRVALYSHDAQGLGHIRRNIALASSIVAAFPHTDILLLTGNPEATQLPLPPNTDIVTLPTIAKDDGGRYRSRVLNSPLDVVVGIRSSVIEAALTSFDPDLLIVDKVPLGLQDELLPALRALRRGFSTRMVLGLREILDDPATTVREWKSMGTSGAIADYYDAVWVYGDQQVYDPVVEYDLPPDVVDKIVYTGYLSAGRGAGTRPGRASTAPPSERPYVLCMVGGGQDGYALARAFVSSAMPDGHVGIVLSGPFMSECERDVLRRCARANPAVLVLDFVSNGEAFAAEARAVVSMAGYNSVCEMLALESSTLLVPRTSPRSEQLIRAQRLTQLGVVDMLLPTEVSASTVTSWLSTAVHRKVTTRGKVDLNGLHRIPSLVSDLVERRDHAA